MNPDDWLLLDSKSATPAEIGQVVAKIVTCLRMNVKLYQDESSSSVKKRKRTSAKNKSVRSSIASCKTFVIREKEWSSWEFVLATIVQNSSFAHVSFFFETCCELLFDFLRTERFVSMIHSKRWTVVELLVEVIILHWLTKFGMTRRSQTDSVVVARKLLRDAESKCVKKWQFDIREFFFDSTWYKVMKNVHAHYKRIMTSPIVGILYSNRSWFPLNRRNFPFIFCCQKSYGFVIS